jgi:hypothetical protein
MGRTGIEPVTLSSDLAVIGAWFVGASVLAARRFRFESEAG